jgi:quinol-cytochrome oxidoreductase complex cytochrome b subunit
MGQADDGVAWYYKPAGIVVLTLFVLGPLALPLVWRSPVISPRGRWIGTGLIVLYTVALVWQVWVAVKIALSLMPQA